MANTVKMTDLSKEVIGALQNMPIACDNAIEKTGKDVAIEARNELRSTSPKKKYGAHKGEYARSWEVKRTKKGKYVVYNKQYQLTHLLENGHQKYLWGRATGEWTKKISHIKPVEEWVQMSFFDRLESELQAEITHGLYSGVGQSVKGVSQRGDRRE